MRIAAFLSHPIQHFTPLWQELSKRSGVELKVFYYSEQGLKPSDDPGFGVKFAWDVDLLAGHNYEFLPRQWPTKDPLDYSWKGLNKHISKHLEEGWDVVYVSGYAHINNWIVARASRRRGIPLLSHGDTNFLIAMQRPWWKLAIRRFVVSYFFKKVSVFLAAGDHNRDYLTHYGALPERIRFCPIPVDTKRFHRGVATMTEDDRSELRRRFEIKPHDFVVGFCGKLRDIKRPQDIGEALNILGRERMVGLFIGCGQMEEKVRQVGGARVRITGFVNQKELPKVLSLCDITVMPSMRDNHPLAVTESQCLGIPVVLSDKCGCYGRNDVFRDGQSGLLYQCGDVKELAEKIGYLANNEDVREQMSEHARELAETQSPGVTAQKLLEAAEFAVGNPR